MRQSGHKVVPNRCDEDLSLVLQSSKCLAMKYSVPIPLELSSDWGWLLGNLSSTALATLRGIWREMGLPFLEAFSYLV